MFQNSTDANNGVLGGGAGNSNGTSMDPTQQQSQQNVNYNGMPPQQQQQQQLQQQQSNNTNKNVRKKPFVKITEQPAGKALRFRYECEGRSAGSIPGANSTPENKTYPSIEIVGIKGRAVVVVSCVTKDTPYRPHPHNLVGKEGCKKGVCTLEINSETMRAVFSNLGIQCVKKKDIESALKAREDIRVDPFKTGFSHKLQPSSIDLNAVRLCFQVFIESEKGRFTDPLRPVVSEPIFDKKAMSDLVICRLCSCSASVLGNTQIILLCEKVAKEDIAVRFYEEHNEQVVWEAYGEFQHSDVHKQTAITFKTPRYRTLDITEPAKVFIQLKRPSDGITSESLPFEYQPLDSGRPTFWNLRRNLKRKPDLELFQEILNVDCGGSDEKPASAQPIEVIDLKTPTKEQQEIQVFITQPSTEELEEAAIQQSMHEIDTIIDEKVRELEQQREQQRQSSVELMDQEDDSLLSEEPRQLSANDKCNEWMKSNEFEKMPSTDTNSTITPQTTIENYDKLSPQSTFDEDQTLRELLGQVAELDGIYTDHVMRRDTYNNSILHELNGIDTCLPDNGQTAMEIDENFDDAATYTSLQIAFKNPVRIPIEDMMPPTPPASHMAPEDAQHYDHVEILTQAGISTTPRTETSLVTVNARSPPRPAAPKLSSAKPHMHITAAEEEKLPPLPPKRLRKLEQDSNAENRSIGANSSDNLDRKSLNQSGTIIIMKSPNQSPPTKRLPAKPDSKFNTLPKQKKRSEEKKPGFFSKLFSRRKSKSDQSEASGGIDQNSLADSKNASKATSPDASREPSIKHFPLIDSKRGSSIRSVKSLQQPAASLPSSPAKGSTVAKSKIGKPVGRSVSSVSGKRPDHLNANVIHIPLKGGDSYNSLSQRTNAPEAYSNASTVTLGNTLDRRTVSALHLADIPLCDGNMELVAITDRQSLRNLCEGEFNVQLDPNVDLTEAEHFALYTSIPPQATVSEFDEMSAYYASVDAGEILTPDEIAKRLAAANPTN